MIKILRYIFKSILLVYLIYTVEFIFSILINIALFKFEFPEGDIVDKFNILLKFCIAWTIVLRSIYGYSIILIFIFTYLQFKEVYLTILRIAAISAGVYIVISLLFGFIILPGTKQFFVFEFRYNQGFFYYSIILNFIAPFILKKIGILKLLNLNNYKFT